MSGRIDEPDGTVVSVVIMKAWLETWTNNQTDETSIIVKVEGEDEDGRKGVASLFLDDEIIAKGADKGKPRVDVEIDNLTGIGMQDGDIDNLSMIEGAHVDFYVKVKDNGYFNYYINFPNANVIETSDAKKLLEAIRGKARKAAEQMAGSPVDGEAKKEDDDELQMKW